MDGHFCMYTLDTRTVTTGRQPGHGSQYMRDHFDSDVTPKLQARHHTEYVSSLVVYTDET